MKQKTQEKKPKDHNKKKKKQKYSTELLILFCVIEKHV